GPSSTECLSRVRRAPVRSLQLRRKFVDAFVQAVDVAPAGQLQALQCALDGLIDHPLDIAAALLDLRHQLAWHIERLANVVEKGLAALVDGISAGVDQALRPA